MALKTWVTMSRRQLRCLDCNWTWQYTVRKERDGEPRQPPPLRGILVAWWHTFHKHSWRDGVGDFDGE